MLFQRVFRKIVVGICALFASTSAALTTWIIAKDNTETDFSIIKTEARVVCYNKNTSVDYTSLKTALDSATKGQEVIVYVGAVATCNETITIKNGVTLTIPFLGKTFNNLASGKNVSTDKTLYKIGSVDDRNSYGNALGDANASNVNTYRSAFIKMRNGADIVNNGTLNLGGASTYCGNNGYYSEINLASGSSITCNSGSTFNCYGYIKENFGEGSLEGDAKNAGMEEYQNIADNSFDSERFLLIKNGATLNTSLAMYDIQQGGGLTGLLNAKKSPFNVFDFQSLQTYSSFEAGATMGGTAIVNGPNDMSIMKELPVISANNSKAALLYLTEGKLSFEYKGQGKYSSRNTAINGLNIVISGALEMGYLYLSEGGGAIEMDTRKFHLPMSSKISMYITDTGRFNCDKKLKFLMGSKMMIKEGGELYVNENVAFYNKDVAPAKDDSSGIYYDSSNKEDALLLNNGLIKINQDSSNKGYLGAFISHSSKTGNAKLDFSSISAASNLSATVEEGTANRKVTVTSSGLFFENSETNKAQFMAGTTYTSGNNNDVYFWNGFSVSTIDITVNVNDGVINPVGKYSIVLSKNADGSSPYNSELVGFEKNGKTSISRGLYFNLSVTDAESVSITKDGASISYDADKWIYANGNFVINIVPSEGVEIYFTYYKDTTYNDKEDKWMQGTGHVITYLQESDTQNGTFTETYRDQKATFTRYIKKGRYFKIGYTWDSKDFIISGSGNNGYTANNKIYTNDENFAPQPATSWNNKDTSNLSDAFLAGNANAKSGLKYSFEMGYYSGHAKADESGGSCLLPTAQVLMANGTYKDAGLIRTGDMVMSFNHETGRIEANKVIGNDDIDKPLSSYQTIHLSFANGKSTDFIYEHGYFDITLNKYVYLHEDDFELFYGHEFVFIEDDKIVSSRLLNGMVQTKYTKLAAPATANHLNLIVDDMLSMEGGLSGLFNIFEYDPVTLAFDKTKMEEDINRYGLLGYDSFEKYFPEEIYNLLPCKYLGVSIGKGLITWNIFEGYVTKWKEQLLENIN